MLQATCASSLSLPISPMGAHWIINLFSCLPRSPVFRWGYVDQAWNVHSSCSPIRVSLNILTRLSGVNVHGCYSWQHGMKMWSSENNLFPYLHNSASSSFKIECRYHFIHKTFSYLPLWLTTQFTDFHCRLIKRLQQIISGLRLQNFLNANM